MTGHWSGPIGPHPTPAPQAQAWQGNEDSHEQSSLRLLGFRLVPSLGLRSGIWGMVSEQSHQISLQWQQQVLSKGGKWGLSSPFGLSKGRLFPTPKSMAL